eukprot:jgi/Chlat1/793/Chrsp104S01254
MTTVACAASVAGGVVGKRQQGVATRSARAPRAAAGRTRVVPVQCQQQEQESSASVAGRGLLLSALAAGLTLASTPMAGASTAYDRCQTDACRELVGKMEAARNANPPPVAPAVAPSPAPAPVVSSGPASSVQPARADDAAAERARARAAAERERADREAERARDASRRAASNNASGGALAWIFGTTVGLAALTATATTVSTGSFSDLTSGNFNGWYRKALDQLRTSNSSVVVGSVGAIVATDAVVHIAPILNLLIPKVLELAGATIIGYYGTKYLVKKEGSPKDDINDIYKVLPSSLPPVGQAVDAVTTTAKTTLNFFKSINPESLTDDAGKYFKSLDNQAAVIALAAGIFVGILLLDNIAHFPILGIVLPKYLELVGVTATLLAANKYALGGGSVQSDADGIVKELTKVQVPVLSSLGSSSSLPSSSSSPSLKDKPKVGASTKAAVEAEVMDVE